MVYQIMEGAVRVLAGEFSRSTLGIPDEDRNTLGWVVTPGGAWCRRMFLTGALTEVVDCADLCRCRVADPSGAFDIVIGGRNTALTETLKKIPVPSFVAITGNAQIYQKSNTISLTVRPEHIRVIDRAERDRTLLITAEYTLRRLEELARVLQGEKTDESLMTAIRHYSLTQSSVLELILMVEEAIGSARPSDSQDSGERPDIPAQIQEFLKNATDPRGIAVDEVIDTFGLRGIPKENVLAALEFLIQEDECYQPQKGYVKRL
jgi:hypothetical protein